MQPVYVTASSQCLPGAPVAIKAAALQVPAGEHRAAIAVGAHPGRRNPALHRGQRGTRLPRDPGADAGPRDP